MFSTNENNFYNSNDICYDIDTDLTVQGDQLNMDVFFWYLGENGLSTVHVYVQWRILNKSLFTRYQKNTAMFSWSPCM